MAEQRRTVFIHNGRLVMDNIANETYILDADGDSKDMSYFVPASALPGEDSEEGPAGHFEITVRFVPSDPETLIRF